jgi:hypothetical protein
MKCERSVFVVVVLSALQASSARAERHMTGLDIDIIGGGGPPFNMGGGILVDARPFRSFQFEALAIAGASLGAKPDGKLGSPVTVAGTAFPRCNLLTWESLDHLAGWQGGFGFWLEPRPRMNSLAIELGTSWGALPFRWGTMRSAQTTEFRYVLYPAFGLRWDSFDENDKFLFSRYTLGVRTYYGPIGAPGVAANGDPVYWGPPGASESAFPGRSWGAMGFASMVVRNYFAFGVEAGGGAVPPSPKLWLRMWVGLSIPAL